LEKVKSALDKIDWNFSDYNSLIFPLDINSMHWYPASFVPQIPSILIEVLSKKGETVFDPFGGSGITAIEAARLGRRFIVTDSNPFAISIIQGKLEAISFTDHNWYEVEIFETEKLSPIADISKFCESHNLSSEVFEWFEESTLSELLSIYGYILQKKNDLGNTVRQTLFSAILNRCCSQRDHYTYITDKCFPGKKVYRPAKQFFLEQLRTTQAAVKAAKIQFHQLHQIDWNPIAQGIVMFSDTRNLSGIEDNSADLVVTSPPYLCVNDYVRSMRLTHLFFSVDNLESSITLEIGARRKRHRKNILQEYMTDLRMCFSEVDRILKDDSFMCLIIGQGRGRVNTTNIIHEISTMLAEDFCFKLIHSTERDIKFRRIQVIGVPSESILVFSRGKKND